MSARQKRWARMARARLIAQLGGVCKVCKHPHGLELDCIRPAGDRHHKLDTSARMSFYHRQHKLKNVQPLCAVCHEKKTATDAARRRKIHAAELSAALDPRTKNPPRHPSPPEGHNAEATTVLDLSEEHPY